MGRTDCTILTLNIFHDLPMYRHLQRRCELIAKAIAAHRPHVAALQEVLRSTASGDIGAELRDRVNRLCGGEVYRLDYAVADGAGEGEFSFDEGVALLSRLETDGPAESLKYRAQVEMATEVAGHRYRLPDDRVAMRRRFRTGERRPARRLCLASDGPAGMYRWSGGPHDAGARARRMGDGGQRLGDHGDIGGRLQ